MKASLLHPSQCVLGEGPIWHEERKCCYWVDIEQGRLYEYNWLSKATKIWRFEYKVTMVAQAKSNQLILALDSGIARFDLISEKIEWLLNIENEPGNRCNDGSPDSHGRLWIGTMNKNFKAGAGSLYCIDVDLSIHKKLDGVTISNGVTWARDRKKLYYIDSPTQTVQSFLFKEVTGEITFEKTVIDIPVELGTPDGMTIDDKGMLWIAHWGGFGIFRWDPSNGMMLGKIEVPVPNVTSCAFAGENLDHMIITTAKEKLSKGDQKKYPESGNTFLVKLNSRGVPSDKCLF